MKLGWTCRGLVGVAFVLLVTQGACRSVPAPKDYARPLAPGQMALEKITRPEEIPHFGNAFHEREDLLQALDRSLAYFSRPSSKRYFPYLDISHERARLSLQKFKEVLASARTPEDLHREILRHFEVYRSVGSDGEGTVLFTGYCEPVYQGSLSQDAVYRYPLYRLPPDLAKDLEGKPLGRKTASGIVPYYTREEIERNGLFEGKNLELVYLRDRFEAYVVHVQGSARIRLTDGKEMRVGYAGKTDHPYQSVGMALVDEGKILRQELSLKRLKDFFQEHPEELERVLWRNPCYVFFTENAEGPVGSLNVVLVPFRSIATDKSVFPRGCLAYVETVIPGKKSQGLHEKEEFRSFVLDHDTGGAIRSAGRADLFMGTGPEAEERAGHVYAEGRLYYLFVREDRPVPAVAP